ncbi:MAG: DUF5020 family protein [Bacteroidales bacterium]
MKQFFTLLFLFIGLNAFSQNLQLHYDFGKAKDGDRTVDRNYFTTTFETFKVDKLGNTFLFVDLDFSRSNGNIGTAYTEISRNWNIPFVKKLQLHTEYNGGIMVKRNNIIEISNTYLFGFTYPVRIGNFVLPISISYRKQQDAVEGADFQFTTSWSKTFYHGIITFSGFLDIWTQDKVLFSQEAKHDGKQFTFLTEPQLWFNLNKSLAIGGEVEISRNFFIFDDQFKAMPTVAFKWNL